MLGRIKTIKIKCIIVTLIIVIASLYPVAFCNASDWNELSNKTLDYKLSQYSQTDVQGYIDNILSDRTSSDNNDWYAISIAKNGSYDFSNFHESVNSSLSTEKLKATDKLRMAISCVYTGGDIGNIGEIIDENWNAMGITSEVFSLILLNSGDFSHSVKEEDIVASIISKQFSDGGWALSGKYADTDVTAMVLQALSSYSDTSFAKDSIEKGIECLSNLQLDNGGYRSYGTENSESCSQVIITLCQLGINPDTDERFIKNGNTVVTALMRYMNENGSFSHTQGEAENLLATAQGFMSLTAISNFQVNGTGFYSLKKYVELNESEPEISVVEPNDEGIVNVEPQEDDESSNYNETPVITEADVIITQTVTAAQLTTVTSNNITNTTGTSTNRTSSAQSTQNTTRTVTTTLMTQTTNEDIDTNSSNNISWKLIASVVACALYIGIVIYVIARKQMTLKKAVIYSCTLAVVLAVIYAIKIQSVNEYYDDQTSMLEQGDKNVTMSISCGVIEDEIGYREVLAEAEYSFSDGDTAFDILKRAAASNEIPIDYVGGDNDIISSVYIRGINGIYEFDYGNMSGWIYTVNGETLGVGCGSYELQDNDFIEWIYTKESGKDVGTQK